MPDPIPVLPLGYAPPAESDRARRRAVNRVALWFAWASGAVAWLAIVLVTVESVLVSGPALFLLGLILVVRGAVYGDRAVLAMGAAYCGVCLLFVGLVNRLRWGPGNATLPFAIMGAAFVLVMAIPTVWLTCFRRQSLAVYEPPTTPADLVPPAR